MSPFWKNLSFLKSVHFKKPLNRSSFLSKSVVIFVVVILKMITLFERNEDLVTGFLKWTDFSVRVWSRGNTLQEGPYLKDRSSKFKIDNTAKLLQLPIHYTSELFSIKAMWNHVLTGPYILNKIDMSLITRWHFLDSSVCVI